MLIFSVDANAGSILAAAAARNGREAERGFAGADALGGRARLRHDRRQRLHFPGCRCGSGPLDQTTGAWQRKA